MQATLFCSSAVVAFLRLHGVRPLFNLYYNEEERHMETKRNKTSKTKMNLNPFEMRKETGSNVVFFYPSRTDLIVLSS